MIRRGAARWIAQASLRQRAIVAGALVLALGSLLAIVEISGDAENSNAIFVTPRTISVADYRTGGRSDSDAIQAAIRAASPGDTVYFPGGRYDIDKPFFFGSGVNHVGDPKVPAVLVGRGKTSLLIEHTSAHPLRNATIQGLRFDNLELRLQGDGPPSPFKNITLKDCVFENGKRRVPWSSDYLWLRYTEGVTIDNCVFLRNATSGGRGVILERTRLTVIKDSYFGTTPDLEDGAPNGYFKTAINLTGYDEAEKQGNEDVVIDGNVWRRTKNPACPLRPAALCEDHGLYAWGAQDLYVRNNYGDGWTNSSSGGAVKLRNSSDAFITGNHFMGSGVLAHTYWHTLPRRLSHVRISRNRIDLLGDDNPGMGIRYSRSKDDSPSKVSLCQASGGERGVFITGNDFVDGGSIHIACANGPELCVADNAGARLNLGVTAVKQAGCEPPDSWDRPLAGIHRGDFNGDGKEDFVQQVRDPAAGRLRWRAHLSSGDGFVTEDWGAGAAVAPDTEKYGVHVGDFNGDGLDDLAYLGLCGSPPTRCWRVHHSTGNGFAPPRNYGNGGQYDEQSFRFKFHVGDFNGDGRDDIAFLGTCGTERRRCWSVLVSKPGNTFAVEDWGDGNIHDSAESDDFGLLVGDFDGDGLDDLAYVGTCGSAAPCLRLRVSFGSGFTEKTWGGILRPAGRDTAHFGMRVGDLNNDGKADIAYQSRCGSSGVKRWRYHLGAASPPFTTTCTASFRF